MANNVIKRIWNQNKMVNIEALQGMAFQAEDGGHTFEISGVDDHGNPVALSGTVAGVFVRPDNADIALSGTASDGKVYVTLSDACYAVPGKFGLTIFVTADGKKTAVYAAIGTVNCTSGGAVAGDTPQDVVDLINAIAAAVATIPASYTGLIADIAPTYSSSAVYPVGAYAYYNGDLYRCTTAITTAETWTAAHWTAAVLGNDVVDLKIALSDSVYNLIDFMSPGSWTYGGVEFTWENGSKRYHVDSHGAASTALTGTDYFSSSNSLPMGLIPGETYFIQYHSEKVNFQIFDYSNGSTALLLDTKQDTFFTLPSNVSGVIIRLRITSTGVTVNEYIEAKMFAISTSIFNSLGILNKGVASVSSSETDLNNYLSSGRYTISCSGMIHTPISSGVGVLEVAKVNTIVIQKIVFTTSLTYIRIKSGSDPFGDWIKVFHKGTDLEWVETISNVDLNDVVDTSFCFVDSSCTNKPPAASDGLLITYKILGSSLIFQQFINYADKNIYIRSLYGESWSAWTNSSMIRTGNGVRSNENLNNITTTSYCFIDSSCTNKPVGTGHGFLITYNMTFNGIIFQQFIDFTSCEKLFQRKYFSGSWDSWTEISGTGDIINNTYNNTYNIDTSPTITTDTNGWLQAIDDETTLEANATDMTGAIMSMLTATGYCKLSPGVFYVSGNIDMPVGSYISGCGKDTVIRLFSSVQNGYILKAINSCTVEKLTLSGGATAPTFMESTTRSGIAFARATGNTDTVRHCMLSDLFIQNFTGSGIYCNNTGGGVAENILACNIEIEACKYGINIAYKSEYHKFTNVLMHGCNTACVNNGGNNVFTACTFHGNTGFVIDNTGSTLDNPGHGSCIGCTFNHIGDNTGIGIYLKNNYVTFSFVGCQMWYGEIDVVDSKGIIFDGCCFGGINPPPINLTNNVSVVFSNDMFYRTPTINQSGNTSLVFSNCYVSDTGTQVTVN